MTDRAERMERKGTWIYRAAIGAMITTTLGFVLKNYYDFQDLKTISAVHTVEIQSSDKEIYDLKVGLQRETGRINQIYENKQFRHYQQNNSQ